MLAIQSISECTVCLVDLLLSPSRSEVRFRLARLFLHRSFRANYVASVAIVQIAFVVMCTVLFGLQFCNHPCSMLTEHIET